MKELSEYSQECSNWDIVCNDPDGTSYYVADIEGALEIDEDGDLRVSLDDAEYDKDDCNTVEMLLDELKKYKLQTKVYLAGHGLYMTWDTSMTYDDEYEEIGFNGIAFGKYAEQSNASGWLTESEKRNLAKDHKEEQLKKNLLRIVLAVMTILLISGAIYNVYALITHSGVMWENIMWSVVCIILTIIGSLTLYFDYNKE